MKSNRNSICQAFQDLMKQGVRTDKLVACVYGLYQDYVIDEDIEVELYALVDPNERFNNPSEYWNNLDEDLDSAWQYIQSHI